MILVVGVGNPDRGDDGIGPHVARLLASLDLPDVEVVEEAEPSRLLDLWDPADRDRDRVVVVDALGAGRSPGSVVVVDVAAQQLPAPAGIAGTHGLGVAGAVELARALRKLPEQLTVVGVEPASVELGEGLSAAVAAATGPALAALVEATDPTAPLAERLAAAGVDLSADPFAMWFGLFQAEGRRATLVDLYALAAAPRGLRPDQLPLAERENLARRSLYVSWPGNEVVPGSDRPNDPVEVVSYDQRWPARFGALREQLAGKLQGAAVRIDHIGSTAVLGLAAKPCIDIQISVPDMTDESAYVPEIESVGLRLRTRDNLHRFFRPVVGRPRDIHVHVCDAGSEWEREHLLFRDYLRTHPAAVLAYAALKRSVVERWHDDRMAYTDAKTGIILRLLDGAEAWAGSTGWTVGPAR